jgi:hypothetical protein
MAQLGPARFTQHVAWVSGGPAPPVPSRQQQGPVSAAAQGAGAQQHWQQDGGVKHTYQQPQNHAVNMVYQSGGAAHQAQRPANWATPSGLGNAAAAADEAPGTAFSKRAGGYTSASADPPAGSASSDTDDDGAGSTHSSTGSRQDSAAPTLPNPPAAMQPQQPVAGAAAHITMGMRQGGSKHHKEGTELYTGQQLSQIVAQQPSPAALPQAPSFPEPPAWGTPGVQSQGLGGDNWRGSTQWAADDGGSHFHDSRNGASTAFLDDQHLRAINTSATAASQAWQTAAVPGQGNPWQQFDDSAPDWEGRQSNKQRQQPLAKAGQQPGSATARTGLALSSSNEIEPWTPPIAQARTQTSIAPTLLASPSAAHAPAAQGSAGGASPAWAQGATKPGTATEPRPQGAPSAAAQPAGARVRRFVDDAMPAPAAAAASQPFSTTWAQADLQGETAGEPTLSLSSSPSNLRRPPVKPGGDRVATLSVANSVGAEGSDFAASPGGSQGSPGASTALRRPPRRPPPPAVPGV